MRLETVGRVVQVARWGLGASLVVATVGFVGGIVALRRTTATTTFQLTYLTHPPISWFALADVCMFVWVIALVVFVVGMLAARHITR
jgi:hypothetical protein